MQPHVRYAPFSNGTRLACWTTQDHYVHIDFAIDFTLSKNRHVSPDFIHIEAKIIACDRLIQPILRPENPAILPYSLLPPSLTVTALLLAALALRHILKPINLHPLS